MKSFGHTATLPERSTEYANFTKNAPLVGPGLTKFPLICGDYTKQFWGPYIDVAKGGVPNPYLDTTSDEDHNALPLSTSSTRLKNLEFALMFPPGTPLAMFEKALPLPIKARTGRTGRNKRIKGTNDANAAERDDAIENAGNMVDLTRKELKRGVKTVVHCAWGAGFCPEGDLLLQQHWPPAFFFVA